MQVGFHLAVLVYIGIQYGMAGFKQASVKAGCHERSLVSAEIIAKT